MALLLAHEGTLWPSPTFWHPGHCCRAAGCTRLGQCRPLPVAKPRPSPRRARAEPRSRVLAAFHGPDPSATQDHESQRVPCSFCTAGR